MTVTGIITAIIVGAIIGALGRLVVPGRQPIPIWLTIVVGIVAAFIGTGSQRALGIPTSDAGHRLAGTAGPGHRRGDRCGHRGQPVRAAWGGVANPLLTTLSATGAGHPLTGCPAPAFCPAAQEAHRSGTGTRQRAEPIVVGNPSWENPVHTSTLPRPPGSAPSGPAATWPRRSTPGRHRPAARPVRAGSARRCSRCWPAPRCSTCGTCPRRATPTTSTPPPCRPARSRGRRGCSARSTPATRSPSTSRPASLWVMVLSARIFGFNSWSLLVPQALMGVASVALLHAAVRRWAGPGRRPARRRGAGPDPGRRADVPLRQPRRAAGAAARRRARTRRCGRSTPRRCAPRRGGWSRPVPPSASGSSRRWARPCWSCRRSGWPTWSPGRPGCAPGCCSCSPRSARWSSRRAGSSRWSSCGRPTRGPTSAARRRTRCWSWRWATTAWAASSAGAATAAVAASGAGNTGFGGAAGILRLFTDELGLEISWLLPAALVALVALVASRGGRRGRDRLRAAALLWGGWTLVTGLVFSFMSGTMHPYYTVALAPGIAALVGVGATALWARRDVARGPRRRWRSWSRRPRRGASCCWPARPSRSRGSAGSSLGLAVPAVVGLLVGAGGCGGPRRWASSRRC